MSGSGFLIYKKDKFNENLFLVLKSVDSDKSLGNKCFDIAKGGIDPGENAYNTAVRELEEEAGLALNDIEVLRDKENKEIVFFVPTDSDDKRLRLMIAKIKDESLNKLTLEKNPYKEHEYFTWKNCYNCEKSCLEYLEDAFNIGEFLIKNHEH